MIVARELTRVYELGGVLVRALDGVSLTIAAVSGTHFEVALIPTTVQVTALGRRPLGWPYNFEADVIAKTVVAWLERRAG